MSDATEDRRDIEFLRKWRDEWADQRMRHQALAADAAALWGGVDAALRLLDRSIDPADLDDEQMVIYEAGYTFGQKMAATKLRAVADDLDA